MPADFAHIFDEHVHNVAKVYPTGGPGTTLTTGGSVWTLGSIVEIIPAGTVVGQFDIHWLNIEEMDKNGIYELELYQGAPGSEAIIASARFVRDNYLSGSQPRPIITPIIEPGTRISGAVMGTETSEDVVLSLSYHEY